MATCEKCGAQLPDGTLFCTECGEKVSAAQAEPNSPAAPETAPPAVAEPEAGGVKSEKKAVPEDKKGPYGALRFAWSLLLLLIPVLNIYLIFKWAFAWGVNINKRNFARGALLALVVVIVVHVALLVIFPQFLSWLGALLAKCVTFLFGVKSAVI